MRSKGRALLQPVEVETPGGAPGRDGRGQRIGGRDEVGKSKEIHGGVGNPERGHCHICCEDSRDWQVHVHVMQIS